MSEEKRTERTGYNADGRDGEMSMSARDQKTEANKDGGRVTTQTSERGHNEGNHEPQQVTRGSLLTIVGIGLLVAIAVAVYGIVGRKHVSAELAKCTENTAAPP